MCEHGEREETQMKVFSSRRMPVCVTRVSISNVLHESCMTLSNKYAVQNKVAENHSLFVKAPDLRSHSGH